MLLLGGVVEQADAVRVLVGVEKESFAGDRAGGAVQRDHFHLARELGPDERALVVQACVEDVATGLDHHLAAMLDHCCT